MDDPDMPWQLCRAQQNADGSTSYVREKWFAFSPDPQYLSLYAEYDPGMMVRRHGHYSPHIVFIIDGGLWFGERWCPAGTHVELPFGAAFGPIRAGDEGAKLYEVMMGDPRSWGDQPELFEAARRSDIALSFEGAIGHTATVARRGSASWSVEVQGATGHSSAIFSTAMGAGSVYEAARILQEFYTELRKLDGLTLNPALIVGGTETSPVTEPRQLDQLSRIEEKAARIEEKFARYEAVLTRAEASLERSAHKVDAAAGTMDFAAIRAEIAALRDRVDATPRAATLFTTAIVTAILTVVLTILVLRFGVPGLMPKLLP
jgi:hypothetical protein